MNNLTKQLYNFCKGILKHNVLCMEIINNPNIQPFLEDKTAEVYFYEARDARQGFQHEEVGGWASVTLGSKRYRTQFRVVDPDHEKLKRAIEGWLVSVMRAPENDLDQTEKQLP